MGRPSNKEARRQQITEGLRKVMAQKGYDGASMPEIAAAAGLTTGLLHYHFKDKQEILLSLMEDLARKHLLRLQYRAEQAKPDAWTQLQAFLECHLALGDAQDPEALACWILISSEALRQEAVRQKFEQTMQTLRARLQNIVQGGIAAKTMVCPDLAAACAAILALIQGYYTLSASARAIVPPGSAFRMAWSMAQSLFLQAPSPHQRQA